MREIKFRAWSGTRFLNPSEVCIFGDGSVYALNQESELGCGRSHIENLSCKIIHYTGLKDKNGVEIYEGDIVKAFIQDSHCLAKVFWSPYNLTFMVEQICKFCKDTEYLSYQPKSIEVIGNIYENPELLEGIA